MANIVETILRLRDETSDKLDDVADSAGDAAEGMEDAKDAQDGLSDAMKTGGAVALALGAAILATTQKLADYKNGINDTATRTGVAADTLTGLQLAFEGSGLSAGAMEAALAPIPKRLADTARGTGEAKVAFDALKVAVVDVEGNLRPTDEVLQDTIGALQDVEDPGLRAALAMQAFGEGGVKVLQALGNTDLDVFVQHAEAIGPAFEDGGAGAADFQRAMADLELSTLGAADRIAQAFGGEDGVTGAIDQATDVVIFFGEFAGNFLEARLASVKALVSDIAETVAAVQRGDFSAAAASGRSALGGLVDAGVGGFGDARDAAAAAGDAVLGVRRTRAATRSAAAAFEGVGGAVSLPPGSTKKPKINGSDLAFQADDPFGLGSGAGFQDPLAYLAEQADAAAEALERAKEAQEARDEQFTRGITTSLGGLSLLTDAFIGAAGLFGGLATGNAAGAIGGAVSGVGSLAAGALDLLAPSIGAAAGAAIGSVVLPVIGTISGAAVGAAITAAIPILGDVLEGVADGVSQAITQVVEVGQIGQAGVEQRLADFQGDFLKGLEVLPAIIEETLPSFVGEFAVALAEVAPEFAVAFTRALIEASPEIARARVEANLALLESGNDVLLGQGRQLLGLDGGVQSGLSSALGGDGLGSGVAGQTIINVSGVIAENLDRFASDLSSRLGSRGLNLQLGAR